MTVLWTNKMPAMRGIGGISRVALLCAASTFPFSPTLAQTAETAADTSAPANTNIIVTARRREESLIAVPVAITAVTSAELSRSAINGTDALARKIPGFLVGEGGGTVQGGTIALRGLSAADGNPLGDQAVSFNIDGVQVARSSIRRMGDFDIESVQVLKGPQSLFFGKNSPGGIISTRTADPSDRFEVGGRLGYEFNADEVRGEGYVSGPLADGFGARLAVYGSDMKGYVKNLVPETDPFAPSTGRAPNRREYAARLTLKLDQGGPFNARFKLGYNNVKDDGSTSNFQVVDCPRGAPTFGGVPDCRGDDRIATGNLGPNFALIPPSGNPGVDFADFGDGRLRSTTKQWLSGLELNYDVSDGLTLTSLTGFYDLSFFNVGNFTGTVRPDAITAATQQLDIREISQEVRLVSDFDGPFNFVAGGQYQDTDAEISSISVVGAVPGQTSVLGRPSPFVTANYFIKQKGEAYSFFGQLQFKPVEQLELSAGGRYSVEEKEAVSVINRGVELVGTQPFLSNGNERKKYKNFSPEVSVSFRPSSDLTVYGNYKHGFLSGGFNGGSFSATGDLTYRPEKVKGFEAGIKARSSDNFISGELALYSYKISDLQVQVTTTGSTQELKNAGEVTSKGIELSVDIRPTRGLSLYGNAAYADGKYDSYYATCYAGQAFLSPGTGIGQCASQPNPTNNNIVGLLQNLSGTRLLRTPKWSGNAGFVYSTDISSSLNLEFSGGLTYSDKYITNPSSQPRSGSPSYTLWDASVRLAEADSRWEVALIGRNLTNKFYWARSIDNPLASSTAPNQLADTLAVPTRGREVMLRVGFKY